MFAVRVRRCENTWYDFRVRTNIVRGADLLKQVQEFRFGREFIRAEGWDFAVDK